MSSIGKPLNTPTMSKRRGAPFALSLYRTGDVVDVRDPMIGAWFHGEVVDVRRLRPQRYSTLPPGSEEDKEPVKRPRHSLDSSIESSSNGSFVRREERLSEVSWDDAFTYTVRLENGGATLGVTGRHLRPRAVKRIDAAKVAVGDQVMANYNVEDPGQRGLWFDAVVTSKRRSGGSQQLQATIFQGPALSPRKECRLLFTEELFVPDLPGTQCNASAKTSGKSNACDSPIVPSRVSRRRSLKNAAPHFGPLPDVFVGQCWTNRVQLSNELVHRPLTGAIDGDPSGKACSLLLSGSSVAEDGGTEAVFVARETRARLADNSRGSAQLVLSHLNLALARNCAAAVDPVKGGDAGERWRDGTSVRVVRTVRGAKAGCRYDGLYKVVSYWPMSAARAWHFRIRRDDPVAAPWLTKDASTTKKNKGPKIVQKSNIAHKATDAELRLSRKRRFATSIDLQMPPPPAKRLLRA